MGGGETWKIIIHTRIAGTPLADIFFPRVGYRNNYGFVPSPPIPRFPLSESPVNHGYARARAWVVTMGIITKKSVIIETTRVNRVSSEYDGYDVFERHRNPSIYEIFLVFFFFNSCQKKNSVKTQLLIVSNKANNVKKWR